jgi:uncharacterized protein (DUF433 family)
MSTIAYPHIESDSTGTPIVHGTRTKVIEIVLDRLAHHWDADEIQRQHPHLTLAQIHAALGYYYDNQAELDEQLRRSLEAAGQIKQQLGTSQVMAKLRAHRLAQ